MAKTTKSQARTKRERSEFLWGWLFIGLRFALAISSGSIYFYICKPAKPAGFAGLLFHGKGRDRTLHFLW